MQANNRTTARAGFPATLFVLVSLLALFAAGPEAGAARARGYADLHSHWFSNFVPGDFSQSVPNYPGNFAGVYCGADPPNPLPPPGLADQAACSLGGIDYPDLGNLPRFDEDERDQKAYWEWIKRAWFYGQRLAVVHAVYVDGACRNPITGRQRFVPEVSCGAGTAILDQVTQTKRFVEWVKANDPDDWIDIAYTPEQARQIIRDGKLAVVLGVEVDDLFTCFKRGNCTQGDIQSGVLRLYTAGVRHIFPIHGIDNAFGGSGLFHEGYGLSYWNYSSTSWFNLELCTDPEVAFRTFGLYGFGIGPLGNGDSLAAIGALLKGYVPFSLSDPAFYLPTHCNALGLTSQGSSLVELLMRLGMIIDIDHMSDRAFDAVHAMAIDTTLQQSIGRSGFYPLVSGHTSIRELLPHKTPEFAFMNHTDRNGRLAGEFHKGLSQIQSILQTDGMIAPILTQRALRTYAGTRTGAPANSCMDSSRTYAQVFQRAVDLMGGKSVGLATDVNGGAPFPGPRYGARACGESRASGAHVAAEKARQRASDRLAYFSDTLDGKVLVPSVTGNRSFDVNVDGVAHYGMVPDMIADMRKVGLDSSDLDVLFDSAESYVDVWERAQPLYQVEPVVSGPIYKGISDTAPAGFVGSRNCFQGGNLTADARWWEFTIDANANGTFPAHSTFRVSTLPLFEGCVIDGTADTPIRVAIPISPKAPLFLGAYDAEWAVTLDHPTLGSQTVTKGVKLTVPRPTIAVQRTAPATIAPGACPTYQIESEGSFERPLLDAAIYLPSTATHIGQPVEAQTVAHTPDFFPTTYSWSALNPLQPLSNGPQANVDFCECGQRTVEITVEEQFGIEDAIQTTVIVAQRPDVAVAQTLFDQYGNTIGAPATAREAAAVIRLTATTPSLTGGPQSCTWSEIRWVDASAADPLASEVPFPAGRVATVGDSCTIELMVWDPAADGGSQPGSKLLRGVVQVSDGIQCGPTIFSVQSDQRVEGGPGDAVLSPVKPLKVAIGAGQAEVFERVKLVVSNQTFRESEGFDMRLEATNLDCPDSVVFDQPRFDDADPDDSNRIFLAPRRRGKATLDLRFVADDFETLGRRNPTRCRIHLQASLLPDNDPAAPLELAGSNNSTVLEIDIIDRNDPETVDGVDLWVKPMKAQRVSIRRGAADGQREAKVVVKNLGTATASFNWEAVQGNCPDGVVPDHVIDELELAPGAKTVLRLPFAVAADGVLSPGKRSPARCHVSAMVTAPDDIDPTNDSTTFSFEVSDQGDY